MQKTENSAETSKTYEADGAEAVARQNGVCTAGHASGSCRGRERSLSRKDKNAETGPSGAELHEEHSVGDWKKRQLTKSPEAS